MKLLRASPSFEIYLVEEDGEIWLHRRFTGEKTLVSSEKILSMDREVDWQQLDREFDSLEELEAHVDSLVPRSRLSIEELPTSATLARVALRSLQSLDSLSEKQQIFVGRLLENEAVQRDLELSDRLRALAAKVSSAEPGIVEPIDVSLSLEEPIGPELTALPRKRTPEFWKQIWIGLGVLGVTFLIAFIEDLLDLPRFTIGDRETSGLFLLYAVGAVFSVQSIFGAFRQDKDLRRSRQFGALRALFEKEAFPFLREQISKIDGAAAEDYYHLPPEDFLIQRLISKDHSYSWGVYYRDRDYSLTLRVSLEEEGSAIRLQATPQKKDEDR